MNKIISDFKLLTTMLLMLTACGCTAASKESAALMSVHSKESLAELRQSAKKLFNGREITINASAFSESNQLMMQRKAIRTPNGQVIDTRVDEPPFMLELFLRDGGCYLRNKDTRKEVRLIKASCVLRAS